MIAKKFMAAMTLSCGIAAAVNAHANAEDRPRTDPVALAQERPVTFQEMHAARMLMRISTTLTAIHEKDRDMWAVYMEGYLRAPEFRKTRR